MKSLGDFLLDRTESLGEGLILEYFVERNDDKVARLLDSEQYLLEGSRGVGKTMLMKAAMLKAIDSFPKDSILPVWVSFEESIRLERIESINKLVDPFLQWTMGKILSETIKKLISLRPADEDKLEKRLASIYGKSAETESAELLLVLDNYVSILEKGDIATNEEMQDCAPSKKLRDILDNPTSFKNFLLELIKEFHLSRIVFFFDEAAHVFSQSQQEKFFTFYKTLRNPKIACKAAVYPGITSYGKHFERGQDAKELKLEWNPKQKADLDFIKNIIKKRLLAFDEKYWAKMAVDKEALTIIAICSNGNPRFAFHLLDEIEALDGFKKTINKSIVLSAVRVVFQKKWTEFSSLKKRLIKYENHIEIAESIMKSNILPNLKVWNERRRKDNKKLSMGFLITTDAFEVMSDIFSILDYSNIIKIDYSRKSSGHGVHSYYIGINPSAIFSDLILKDVNEFENVSVAIEHNQSYSENSDFIEGKAIQVKISDEYKCSNQSCDFITTEEYFNFCPKCASKIKKEEVESLYKILRSHPLGSLPLSEKILTRLNEKFFNVGDIYDAEIDEIKTINYIKDIRANKIKGYALEYMAG